MARLWSRFFISFYISFSHEWINRNEWFWINFLQNVILNSCGVSPLPAVPRQAVPLTPSLTPFRGGLRGLSDTRNLRKALWLCRRYTDCGLSTHSRLASKGITLESRRYVQAMHAAHFYKILISRNKTIKKINIGEIPRCIFNSFWHSWISLLGKTQSPKRDEGRAQTCVIVIKLRPLLPSVF